LMRSQSCAQGWRCGGLREPCAPDNVKRHPELAVGHAKQGKHKSCAWQVLPGDFANCFRFMQNPRFYGNPTCFI
jgi:hypothetical protein